MRSFLFAVVSLVLGTGFCGTGVDYGSISTASTLTNEVLDIGIAISNDVESATYAAVTNTLRSLGFDTGSIDALPAGGVYGPVGAVLAALAAAAAWLKKNKVQTLKLEDDSIVKNSENGVAKLDDFFKESNSLLMQTMAIPFASLPTDNTTSSYKRFRVTVTDDMTLVLHTPTSGDAEIFECRFDGSGLTADKSISFATSGAAATTMDTDCGTVKAGKVALMSAFWNGATWDVNWKVEG